VGAAGYRGRGAPNDGRRLRVRATGRDGRDGAATAVTTKAAQHDDEETRVDERAPAEPTDDAPVRSHDDAPAESTGDAPAESTGDAAVDEALTLLASLDAQPLRGHVAAFDAVHGALQDRLADAEG
jgi:hypothetical protein